MSLPSLLFVLGEKSLEEAAFQLGLKTSEELLGESERLSSSEK